MSISICNHPSCAFKLHLGIHQKSRCPTCKNPAPSKMASFWGPPKTPLRFITGSWKPETIGPGPCPGIQMGAQVEAFLQVSWYETTSKATGGNWQPTPLRGFHHGDPRVHLWVVWVHLWVVWVHLWVVWVHPYFHQTFQVPQMEESDFTPI